MAARLLTVFLLLNLVSWKILILMQCLIHLWFSHNHWTPCHTLYHVWRQLRFRLASVIRHLTRNNIWSHAVLKISTKSQFICKRVNFSGSRIFAARILKNMINRRNKPQHQFSSTFPDIKYYFHRKMYKIGWKKKFLYLKQWYFYHYHNNACKP